MIQVKLNNLLILKTRRHPSFLQIIKHRLWLKIMKVIKYKRQWNNQKFQFK